MGEDYRELLKNKTVKISNRQKDCCERIVEMDETIKNFLNEATRIHKEILLRSENFKRIIDQHTDCLLLELDSIKLKRLKELNTVKDELEKQKIKLESFENYAKEIIASASTVELCRSFQDLIGRSDELEMEQISGSDIDHQISKRVVFIECNMERTWMQENNNIVGKLFGK